MSLPAKVLVAIEDQISSLFREMAISFLGKIPTKSASNVKTINVAGSIGQLFIESLGTTTPDQSEVEAFKSILTIANNYIKALEEKTKAEVSVSLNAYLSESKMKDESPELSKVRQIIQDEIKTAGDAFRKITEGETNRSRNIGTVMKIIRVAKSQGIDDPTLFWIVTHDDRTAEVPEKNIHLILGTQTPRLWKLSEFSFDYYKKGDDKPSILGGHFGCRCFLTYLAPGYTFSKGADPTYKSEGWDELRAQRGLPQKDLD